MWFYEGADFPMLQCVWPDGTLNFPWDSEFNAQSQPVLADNSTWPFNEAKNLGVFTTRQVVEEGEPIRLVAHNQDGDWQFLCGTTSDASDALLVTLQSVVARDISVTELADLPPGWQAIRDGQDEPWQRATED